MDMLYTVEVKRPNDMPTSCQLLPCFTNLEVFYQVTTALTLLGTCLSECELCDVRNGDTLDLWLTGCTPATHTSLFAIVGALISAALWPRKPPRSVALFRICHRHKHYTTYCKQMRNLTPSLTGWQNQLGKSWNKLCENSAKHLKLPPTPNRNTIMHLDAPFTSHPLKCPIHSNDPFTWKPLSSRPIQSNDSFSWLTHLLEWPMHLEAPFSRPIQLNDQMTHPVEWPNSLE